MSVKQTVVSIALTLGALGPMTVHAEPTTHADSSYATGRLSSAQPLQQSNVEAKDRAFSGENLNALSREPARLGKKSPVLDIAKALGMDRTDLQAALHSGQSLLSVAQNNGVTRMDLQSRLHSQLRTKLEREVANGKISVAKQQATLHRFNTYFPEMLKYIDT